MKTHSTHICPKCGNEYGGAEVFCPIDATRLVTASQIPSAIETLEQTDPLIGQVLQNRYRVIDKLGEGGMGVVYVAEHVEIEKKVALKVLREDFSKRPEVVERFRQEARSASKIGDPHIVDVTDFGQLEDGGVFFAMECLEGEVLSDVMNNEPLPLGRAAPIIRQIARALRAAHKKGIVHRDLKPENVFLVDREDAKDFVKILDFGIAKISDRDASGERLTKTGMIFGTPEYMSPEQASGRPLDHRVDVYALGCIMFEMFTGRVPYDGDTFMAVLTQHMFEPVPNISQINPDTDVPESVRAVVYKAMAKELEERYADMQALEDDLNLAIKDSSYVIEIPSADRISDFSRAAARASLGTGRKAIAETLEGSVDWDDSGKPSQMKKVLGVPLLPAVAALIVIGGGVLAYALGVFNEQKPIESIDAATQLGGMAGVVQTTPAAVDAGEAEMEFTIEQLPEETDPPAEPPRDTAAASGGAPDGIDDAAPKMVAVRVQTDPKGAVVMIEDKGQVCSRTPCQVDLPAGISVEISAKSGKKAGKMTFTPSEQNKELVLSLKRSRDSGSRKRTRTRKPKPRNGQQPPTKTKPTTGLKIPDVFMED